MYYNILLQSSVGGRCLQNPTPALGRPAGANFCDTVSGVSDEVIRTAAVKRIACA